MEDAQPKPRQRQWLPSMAGLLTVTVARKSEAPPLASYRKREAVLWRACRRSPCVKINVIKEGEVCFVIENSVNKAKYALHLDCLTIEVDENIASVDALAGFDGLTPDEQTTVRAAVSAFRTSAPPSSASGAAPSAAPVSSAVEGATGGAAHTVQEKGGQAKETAPQGYEAVGSGAQHRLEVPAGHAAAKDSVSEMLSCIQPSAPETADEALAAAHGKMDEAAEAVKRKASDAKLSAHEEVGQPRQKIHGASDVASQQAQLEKGKHQTTETPGQAF